MGHISGGAVASNSAKRPPARPALAGLPSRTRAGPDGLGKTRFVAHPGRVPYIPPRRSAQPLAYETQEEHILAARSRPRRRLHWMVYVGLGAMVALSISALASWASLRWTDTLNDWTSTQAFRTFSVDQAVGHNHDSAAHPSHFLVQNDKRRIVIIEFPADDPAKDVIYYGPMFAGDDERTPVTISFQLNGQTGRLDLALHAQEQTFVFVNNGTKFVPPAGQ